ncbi:MAG: Flp pilus assembly protein CpaB [Mycobacteriales bacterium]
MGRRTVLLVAAFLIAAVGTGLVFAYVSNVDNRALADQNPKKVLVVKKLVGQGTSVSDAEKSGAFELKEFAASSIAPGALSDLAPVREMVTLAPLFPGEQVLQAKFGSAGSSSILAIPTGKIAVSVQLGDPARVAGFVQPGAEVAVFVTLNAALNGKTAQQLTNVLLPRASVIAVGPTTITKASGNDAANTEALPRAILTLALTQQEAQKLIFAEEQGQLYFGLLDKDSKTGRGGPVTLTNLFS